VLARVFLRENEPVRIIGDLVRLTYVENPGIAFGIQIGGKVMFTVMIGLASLAILFYLYRMRGDHFPARFALALILGGALGNLFDRIAFGRVVDFVDLDFPDFIMERWPVFNVADIAVTVGMIILITLVLTDRGSEGESVVSLSEEKQEPAS
jgi:signal peptidase II